MKYVSWWQSSRGQGVLKAIAASDKESYMIFCIPVWLNGWYTVLSQLAIDVNIISRSISPNIDPTGYFITSNTWNVRAKVLIIAWCCRRSKKRAWNWISSA
jgi:hypothetical protein